MTINAIGILPCKTDSCPTMGDYAIKKKANVKWGNHKVGDVVLFDFNHNGTSDHIGILEAINKDGSITTIEGNTSLKSSDNGGKVMRRTRYKKDVNYFVRPKYNSDVTAQMVLATARAEIGVVESPSGSNKVKYNVWFYGSNKSAYWCCTSVCWIFAHVKGEEKPIPKPTSKYTGAIAKPLLKVGSTGNEVKNLQTFLNWYGAKCGDVDGEFGSKTAEGVCVFQKTEGIDVDGEYGDKSYSKALAYKESVAEKYGGEFPDFVIHSRNYLNKVAKDLAYAKNTSAKTYSYKTGKAKGTFTTAIKKVYGSVYSKWSKQCRLGASCDVFVGTVLRYSGCDTTWARGLDTQVKKTPKHMTQVTDIKECDMLYYLNKGGGGHTRMVVTINGTRYNCEANHNYKGGQYGHIGSKAKKPTNKKPLKMFRVTSAFRTFLANGDVGSEVTKWQNFLIWCGYNIKADGDFGPATLSATVDFQRTHGLAGDGEVGEKTISIAKGVEK